MNRIVARYLSSILLTVLPVSATFAQATGGPAGFVHQSASSAVEAVRANADAQIGPYQRHLMVNGMPEDEAARAAKVVDHARDPARARFAKAR